MASYDELKCVDTGDKKEEYARSGPTMMIAVETPNGPSLDVSRVQDNGVIVNRFTPVQGTGSETAMIKRDPSTRPPLRGMSDLGGILETRRTTMDEDIAGRQLAAEMVKGCQPGGDGIKTSPQDAAMTTRNGAAIQQAISDGVPTGKAVHHNPRLMQP